MSSTMVVETLWCSPLALCNWTSFFFFCSSTYSFLTTLRQCSLLSVSNMVSSMPTPQGPSEICVGPMLEGYFMSLGSHATNSVEMKLRPETLALHEAYFFLAQNYSESFYFANSTGFISPLVPHALITYHSRVVKLFCRTRIKARVRWHTRRSFKEISPRVTSSVF